MGLQVLGARPCFWQWDSGQKLEVRDTECGEIHFYNGTTDCALVVSVKQDQNGTRTVEVPNILLQSAKPIRVFLFQRNETSASTRVQHTFQVLPRSKPSDYVYTETEILDYKKLYDQMETLEDQVENKLDANKLPAAIDAALEQAKKSGMFDGPPGKTPEKGVDYNTPEDQKELVNAVIAALPTWSGGSY